MSTAAASGFGEGVTVFSTVKDVAKSVLTATRAMKHASIRNGAQVG